MNFVRRISNDLIYSNDPSGYIKALKLKKKYPGSLFDTKFFRYTLAYAKYSKTN